MRAAAKRVGDKNSMAASLIECQRRYEHEKSHTSESKQAYYIRRYFSYYGWLFSWSLANFSRMPGPKEMYSLKEFSDRQRKVKVWDLAV